MTSELIEKETIDVTKIVPSTSPLSEEVTNRLAATQRLGNEFKAKATIEFNTVEGPKRVNTTVWAVTEKYIQLKNNIHIPISSVIDIDF